jgi:hypothetical protein
MAGTLTARPSLSVASPPDAPAPLPTPTLGDQRLDRRSELVDMSAAPIGAFDTARRTESADLKLFELITICRLSRYAAEGSNRVGGRPLGLRSMMRPAGYKAVVHTEGIIASKITQPSSSVSLLITGLVRS